MSEEMIKNPKLVIFDLDGTLTESKQPIDDEMIGLLKELLRKTIVVIISGSWFPQFERQFLSKLENKNDVLRNLYLCPTNATSCFRYQNGWKKEYEEGVLSEDEKKRVRDALDKATRNAGYVIPAQFYGEPIEDRVTQISLSPLGQEAPLEAKQKWSTEYNPRRLDAVHKLAEYLPDFEVRAGGLTTIDITRKGIDKAYGVKKILELTKISIEETLFVGDALYTGGNDEPAKRTGVQCMQVSGPEETKELIRKLNRPVPQ